MAAQRPGVLTTLCVLGLVLGGLGVVGSGMGLFALLGQGAIQGLQERQLDQFERQAGPAGESMVESQRQMQTRLNELQGEWLPVTASINGLNFLFSVLLVVGSVLGLGLKPRAPLVFTIAAGALMLVDTASAAFSSFMSMKTMDIMKEFASGMTDDPAFHQPGAPDIGGFMESIMGAAAIGGLIFAGAWWLIKMGYYVWSLRTLRKPNIKELFSGTA